MQKTTSDVLEFKKNIEKAKRNNGLIEKIADKIKGLTGIGASSKKLNGLCEKIATSEITSEQAQKELKKYRSSQENTAQAIADIASSGASIGVFLLQSKKLKN